MNTISYHNTPKFRNDVETKKRNFYTEIEKSLPPITFINDLDNLDAIRLDSLLKEDSRGTVYTPRNAYDSIKDNEDMQNKYNINNISEENNKKWEMAIDHVKKRLNAVKESKMKYEGSKIPSISTPSISTPFNISKKYFKNINFNSKYNIKYLSLIK